MSIHVRRARDASAHRPARSLASVVSLALLVLLLAPSVADAAPNTTYNNRLTFEAQLAVPIVDGYDAPPYDPGFSITSDADMSSRLGETDYQTTGFLNWNILSGTQYCAGCNGSFLLSFQTTSVGTAAGVFGVGMDITVNSSSLPYHAFVTFADGSTQDFALPLGPAFWGITSNTLIRNIHFGLAGGGTTRSGSFQIDNLTIGAIGCTDTTPPTVTCALARTILWPARNGLVPVGLSVGATDNEDPNPTIDVTVYSDEPVGAAPYAPDALLLGGSLVLRAERDPAGNGRVYLVVVRATDACGNVGYACCTAVVPRMATGFWIVQVLAEAAAAQSACQASGTGSPGAYTQVSP